MDLFDQYFTSLQADGRTPATIAWHRACLSRFKCWLDASELPPDPDLWTPVVLRQYIVHLSETPSKTGRPLTGSSLNSMVRSLKAFCRWLKAEGVIERDLFVRVNVPTAPSLVMEVLSPTGIRSVVQVIRRRGRHQRRGEAIFLLMLDTGARASELCGLDLDAVSFEQRLVTLYGKGRKTRIVPFSAATARAMLRYLRRERGSEPGPLFQSDRRTRLTRSGLLQLCTRIGRDAAVELHPHKMRHTMATEYLKAGGNVFALQRLLGHTELTITTRYVQLATDDLSDAHERFSPVTRLTP